MLQCIIPPLLAAELIFHIKSKRHQYLYRVLLSIPMVVPEIVNQLIWQLIYDGDGGILNRLLELVGMGQYAANWLGNSSTALWSLILMYFPWIHAFNMLLFFSGLQGLSTDVLESATLDGLSAVGKVVRIHIPYLLSQFKIAIILAIIACLQSITAPLVMTSGGPGYATYTPALYMYLSAFSSSNFGYSCAISVVMFLLVLSLTILSNRMKSQTDFNA
ncbi:MAG: sugar ABC transporter permease [Eubacteriales bacterium]|nr:sugar ABC transporter permease [Eubacteriales bacterium]